MMKTKLCKAAMSVAMAVCIVASAVAPSFALDSLGTKGQHGQRTTDSTIDTSLTGSLELYKIDFTNAEKDGVWNAGSYVSTGIQDDRVNDTLINNAIRAGDDDTISDLGNGETAKGYAVKGVEFTYLKVGDIVTYTKAENNVNKTMVLYGIDMNKDGAMLSAIGLDRDDRYALADGMESRGDNYVYFESNTLVNALRVSLAANATTVKNALENHVAGSGVKMPETSDTGYTHVDGLPLGLYLLVETKVPEMVTNTTNPFFVSIPMTTVDGTNTPDHADLADGGQSWLYDVTLYPKNETGIPSLEKTVRESESDTGENHGSTDDIHDGYAHTGTGSAGDIFDYQIISTLPSITSKASQLSVYGFKDVLSKGLSYVKKDVKIEWFKDEACTPANKITEWDENSGKFTVTYSAGADGASVMNIDMTATGLQEINESTAVWTAADQVRRGYSDCTMRITYTAKMDSDVDTNFGELPNDNTVTMTWKRSNDKYYDTLVDDTHIYTFGLELTKTFTGKDNNLDANGDFNEVQFVVWNESDGYWVKADLNEAEGVYYVVDHLDENGNHGHNDNATHAGLDAQKAAKQGNATIFTPVTKGSLANASSTQGKVIIKGLEDDTYVITEIRTANGYTLLKDDIRVAIKAEENGRLCDIYGSDTLGVVQNDPRYASVRNANLDTVLGFGGVEGIADGINIPQTHLDHSMLSASATVDNNNVNMKNDDGAHALVELAVVNTHGFDLPQTGEIGIILLPMLGLAGLAGCMFLLVFLRKKGQEEV